MKILAIDTSSFPASVAVVCDGLVLGEYVIRNQRKHSQNVMIMTERLLGDLAIDISEIDVFAVTVGPGSFTGLRIGISTIRALAQAMNKPVVALNTLEALANNMSSYNGIVMPMLDARRDEVFVAVYKFTNGKMNVITEPTVMTISELGDTYKDALVLGDGAIIHKDELSAFNYSFAPLQIMETRASTLGIVAYEKTMNGDTKHYNEIQPLYLRKSQAEREYERKKDK